MLKKSFEEFYIADGYTPPHFDFIGKKFFKMKLNTR